MAAGTSKEAMRQAQQTIAVETTGPGLYEVTADVVHWVLGLGIGQGLLTLFCQHTSASLTIQEKADPDVRHDLERFFADPAPHDPGRYRHATDGPDDMPAHIRSALTDTSLAIPVTGGAPALGVWQGIYLFEHLGRPCTRRIVLHLAGD